MSTIRDHPNNGILFWWMSESKGEGNDAASFKFARKLYAHFTNHLQSDNEEIVQSIWFISLENSSCFSHFNIGTDSSYTIATSDASCVCVFTNVVIVIVGVTDKRNFYFEFRKILDSATTETTHSLMYFQSTKWNSNEARATKGNEKSKEKKVNVSHLVLIIDIKIRSSAQLWKLKSNKWVSSFSSRNSRTNCESKRQKHTKHERFQRWAKIISNASHKVTTLLL